MTTTAFETSFTFRGMDSTLALEDHAHDKLTKLEKYLPPHPAKVHVIFNVEGARHKAEITINIKGKQYFGMETSNDMYTSIDAAVDKIKKQVSKTKERVKGHKGE